MLQKLLVDGPRYGFGRDIALSHIGLWKRDVQERIDEPFDRFIQSFEFRQYVEGWEVIE